MFLLSKSIQGTKKNIDKETFFKHFENIRMSVKKSKKKSNYFSSISEGSYSFNRPLRLKWLINDYYGY